MDITTLSAAIDFSDVGTVLLAVATGVAAIYLGFKGLKIALRGLKSL